MVTKTINKVKTIDKEVAQKRISEKAFRAERSAKIWNDHPLFKGKLEGLDEATRQRLAINLTNQARFMKTLNESETSAEFNRMAPANVMRLVQLTMTNINRGNVFNEFAMETARDAIYYIKPYLSKPFAGTSDFSRRSDSYDGTDSDPYGFKTRPNSNNNEVEINSRRTIYETTEDRFANELANGTESKDSDKFVVTFKGDAFGTEGEKYIPGYITIYADHDPQKVIAVQDSTTYKFYIAPEYTGTTITEDSSAKTITVDFSGITGEGNTTPTNVSAFARFNSEEDYEGESMGEVNLLMDVYELRPHRTSIGVSWTKLAEITLGASFNTQADDVLLASASDVIAAQMDYRAFKEAYQFARTNPSSYTVHFDAAYTGTATTAGGTTTFAKDGYVDNAATFSSAIEIASAAIYEDRKRGAVNKLIVGADVVPYLKLNPGFTPKGVQDPAGVFKVGELDGVDVYRAPTEVIPTNEVLAVYKNPKVENDVAITYGTLIPFVSARLDYPTMYSRVGLASYGDRAVLNKLYLARIVIDNLKDTYKK